MALAGFTAASFVNRTPAPRSSTGRGGVAVAGAATSASPMSLAAQLVASAQLPPPPRPAIYIRKVGDPLSATPWDPLLPVPPGYELVSGIEVREQRSLIERGKRSTLPRAGDVSVVPLSSLPAQRREAQRQRTEARAAARKERREQLKRKRGAALGARLGRDPRPARSPRPPRASRRPRKPRQARPARPSRAPRPGPPRPYKRQTPVGLCKISDDTGGCWNAGTCGPSPLGGPGVVGHCIFKASEDCNQCQQGSCDAHGRALIQKMLAFLPASWRADPAHREQAVGEAAKRRARRVRRRVSLPPEVAPAARAPIATGPVVLAPASTGPRCAAGICCGLTGVRCHSPGTFCGPCSAAQQEAARIMGMV